MPKKQKSGLYRTKIKIGVDADGKNVYKWISGKTQRELEQQRQAIIDQYIMHTAPCRDVLFGTYAAEWYSRHIKAIKRSSTCKTRRSVLNRHLLPAFGNHNLRSLTSGMLQDYLNGLSGRSSGNIGNILTTLRQIMRSAVADHMITFDPTLNLHIPAAPAPNPRRALTDAESAALIAQFDQSVGGLCAAILYYTGMRIGEATALRWDDIDFAAHVLHVRGSKTDAAERYVPLVPALAALLLPVRSDPERYVIHAMDCPAADRPIGETALRKHFYRVCKRAGIGEDITPHYLRHNFVTLCWRAGVDIALCTRIVGHKSYTTTYRIYTHLGAQDVTAHRDSIDGMFVLPATSSAESCTKVAQAKCIDSKNACI